MTDKEEMSFSVGIRRGFNRWNGVALQQVEDVLPSSMALERLGNVAIDEKRLRGKGQAGSVNPNQPPHFVHLVVLGFDNRKSARLRHVLFQPTLGGCTSDSDSNSLPI